jgi:hypothetical protein
VTPGGGGSGQASVSGVSLVYVGSVHGAPKSSAGSLDLTRDTNACRFLSGFRTCRALVAFLSVSLLFVSKKKEERKNFPSVVLV